MNNKTFSQFIVLLALIMLFFLLTVGAIAILQAKGVEMWRMNMAMMTLQNIGIFIIPAIITARIFNPGQTMQAMQLNRLPGLVHIALMVLIYFASMPAMNAIVNWNESWQLPEALSWMTNMEATAQDTTEQIMDISSIGQLITVILLVGVLTGIGEEFLFRGTLQRLLLERKINVHAAVWITAF
ncbi:MAG: CPBP family intramembrane metalloprotease, partial [Bacteroidales bacterium]|nr:CPBP family intramembrane metalloprotease [Bacteroidales bacterium]